MNDTELLELARLVRGVIEKRIEHSPELRRASVIMARWLLEIAGERPREGIDGGEVLNVGNIENVGGIAEKNEGDAGRVGDAAASAKESKEAGETRSIIGAAAGSRGIVPLKIGDAVITLPVAGTTEEIGRARAAADEGGIDPSLEETWWDRARDVDLSLIEARSRLKARSCELYVERSAAADLPESGARGQALYEEIGAVLRQAKLMKDCFLWVLYREREQPPNEVVLRIAGCYRALAESAAVMRRIDEAGERAGDSSAAAAMQLLAEADSALRVALEATWLTAPDKDQDETHLWLKRETSARRIFIARHMTISDPGDPERAQGIVEEARALGAEVARRLAASKGVESALTKLKYHAVKALADKEAYQFDKIAEVLESLSSMGVRPTDRRVVELFSAGLIAEAPAAFLERAEVREAVAAASKRRNAADTVEEDEPRARVWSARVGGARALLEGRAVVMVGGEPRNEAIERLRSAFGLSRVDWVHLTEHGSSDALRGPIMRADCAAVLVLIKLTGHLHADEAQRYARAAGKPCVYLPAGYNPEQVAEALLQQAGERLREGVGSRE